MAQEIPILHYGPHREQTVEFRTPQPDSEVHGVAALIHGGYWRMGFDATLMEPLAADLANHGWVVANIEYRRGNDGEWPKPLDDVRTALTEVASSRWRKDLPGPVVGIGHSVGGQLALLAADLIDAVVALAPVTDATRTFRENLGEGAAAEFFGDDPESAPELYASASPTHNLPINAPSLLLHGATDRRVPLEHSLDFASKARLAGDHLDLHSPHALDHLEAIDPQNHAWAEIRCWMKRAAAHFPQLHNSSVA